MKQSSQSGQVAIIVLIISTIVLSLGLTFSKKTTIETKIDTDEELLKKAFNAAESGIDYFLGTGKVSYTSPDNQSSSDVATNVIGNGHTLDFDETTPVNTAQVYWLVGHNDDGSLNESVKYTCNTVTICPTFSGTPGALKIDYLFKNGTNYGSLRTGFNFGTSPNVVTEYDTVTTSCATLTISNPPTNVPLVLAITPLFSSAKIPISGGCDFPPQGIEILSSGKAGNTDSPVVKNLKVEKRYRLPDFFLEAVTAAGQVRSTN